MDSTVLAIKWWICPSDDKQELSGSERAFERGDSEGNVATQTTFLVDKIVDAVPVIGYDVIEQKMTPVEGVYETFVLLKLPYD